MKDEGSTHTRRETASFLKKLGLIGLWVGAALAILEGGKNPGYYDATSESTYPLAGVLTTLAVSLLELVAVWRILHPAGHRRSWSRLVAGLALFVVLAAFSFVLAMHAPGYIIVHAFWVITLVLVLAVALLVSVFTAACRWITSKR
mgnify:CR=1 FL=1